jgi:hypothetical protein
MLDTSLRSPSDIAKVGEGAPIDLPKYVVNPLVVMLHHASPNG